MSSDYMSAADAAQQLGISTQTFYKWVQGRKIYGYRIDGERGKVYKRAEVQRLKIDIGL